MRGTNDDELIDLLEYGRSVGAEVRFIEYMDVGGATRWRRDAVVSQREMLAASRGALRPRSPRSAAAARPPPTASRLPDGTTFGIIASTTQPFCADCDRSRLTADGVWLMCLYAQRRHRPAPAAARRRDARRPGAPDSHGLVAARRSRRRGTARRRRARSR